MNTPQLEIGRYRIVMPSRKQAGVVFGHILPTHASNDAVLQRFRELQKRAQRHPHLASPVLELLTEDGPRPVTDIRC
ncbi:hypothetical protein HYV74_03420 [Candidatus Uhrbacteria bacterium]|nr:hypothetical protein [Candidatus Uhrbacteria bacterium]